MLKGLSAIVTGSTSGIGLEVAKRLAKAGSNVMLNGFGEAKLIEGIRQELINSTGVKVGFNGANLAKSDEIFALVQSAEKQFGRIDILVNNAGVQHTSPIEDFSLEQWQQIIDINLTAPFILTKAVLPLMKGKKFGRIINIASVHGLVASVNKSAYVSAKHGLVGLTKAVALETANFGVTANAVCPGWVETPLVEKQIEQMAAQKGLTRQKAAEQLISAKQPMWTFTQAKDIGDLVVFLCSDAARTITGATLEISGGWTAQ